MEIEKLLIGSKTANQGVNASGKLSALEFNALVTKVNEMIEKLNSTVYITQEEYDTLLENGSIQEDVEYNVYEK